LLRPFREYLSRLLEPYKHLPVFGFVYLVTAIVMIYYAFWCVRRIYSGSVAEGNIDLRNEEVTGSEAWEARVVYIVFSRINPGSGFYLDLR